MRIRMVLAALLLVGSGVAWAGQGVLDVPVTLKTESDLYRALMAVLQHSVKTSEAYRGQRPQLKRFAQAEVERRKKDIRKLAALEPGRYQEIAIVPAETGSDQAYLQSMLTAHARAQELLEFGKDLPKTASGKRLVQDLERSIQEDFLRLADLQTMAQRPTAPKL